MNKMKVVLVSPLPPPNGGIATWTKKILQHAYKYGIDYNIVNTALCGKRSTNVNNNRDILNEISRTYRILKYFLRSLKRSDLVHVNSSCSKYGIIRDYLVVKIAHEKNKKTIMHYRCN